MGERKFSFVPGEFYHVYNRGNSKQIIFCNDTDYRRFQILLYLCNSKTNFKVEYLRKQKIDFFKAKRGEQLVAIGAYCLMPNHYHLLVTPLIDNGVSMFMRKLGTGYSMYFNALHHRTGSLFEGKFKAQIANTDEYLKYLFSYIHLNPLKITNPDWRNTGVTETEIQNLSEYEYSSFFDMLSPNCRRENAILNQKKFPDYFHHEPKTEHLVKWLSNRKDLLHD